MTDRLYLKFHLLVYLSTCVCVFCLLRTSRHGKKVGNEAFVTFAISHGVPIYRVVHHRDPVPHVPFEVWGYRHPPTEVFFNADQTSYLVCDDSGEDLACSDQFWVGGG